MFIRGTWISQTLWSQHGPHCVERVWLETVGFVLLGSQVLQVCHMDFFAIMSDLDVIIGIQLALGIHSTTHGKMMKSCNTKSWNSGSLLDSAVIFHFSVSGNTLNFSTCSSFSNHQTNKSKRICWSGHVTRMPVTQEQSLSIHIAKL